MMYRWFFTIFLLANLISCYQNSFYDNCEELRDIIRKANDLLEVVDPENNYDDFGNINSTTIKFNKRKSANYTLKNSKRIDEIYSYFKNNFKGKEVYESDSIYILVFTNKFLKFITGVEKEDMCDHLSSIQADIIPNPSKWLLDNFFGPLFTTPETIGSWKSISDMKKTENVKRYLLSTYESSCKIESQQIP